MKNELYHSDTYLGKDYSDGIKHYKYIKREMVNGKWRYYYEDDKANQLRNEATKAENNRLRVNSEVRTSHLNYKRKDQALREMNRVNSLAYRAKKAEKAEKLADKRYRNYMLSSIPRRVILKATVAVANLISGISAAVSKKKRKK